MKDSPLTLKCQCCGFERDFIDSEDAFKSAWDAPPHFTQFICCDLCPTSFILLGVDHSVIHKRWESQGRPVDFGPDCVN